jgi:methyl coenzyme M reductase alpha subunit
MITIEGLTRAQQVIADRLWSIDTTEAVEQYIQTLPRSLKREAWVVQQLIIAAELDSYMEVTDELRLYLCGR